MNFQRILNLRFTKLLEDHSIPANSDINERLEDLEQMKQVWVFLCKNRFLYLGATGKF